MLRHLTAASVLAILIAGPAVAAPRPLSAAEIALLNRVSWGASASSAADLATMGSDRWLERQLHPSPADRLPAEAQQEIDALAISHTPMATLVQALNDQNKAANLITDPDQKKVAQTAYQQAMTDLARQAATREILRDLYSPDQLQEQMTWFWFNHFNVHEYKANLRAMVGDYEETAIRPHALGRFRDLLEATLRHPAMLRYLDNADNAAGHINENYAREIMELHTMGVGSGYSQDDVQALARILTGVGIDPRPNDPQLPLQLRGQLIREGLFAFNPARHDYGDKTFLGRTIRGRGFGEVEEALDILCRQPATATHISRELAVYFVADDPPDSLVQRMSHTFQHSDGDIAQVLGVMFKSPEFRASLGTKFKDPAHFAISAVRLAWGDTPILNTAPVFAWMNRLGEGLYAHETPDGYAMIATAWNGPGQMETRFELARQIGSGGAGLFRADGATGPETPIVADLKTALQSTGLADTLSPAADAALAQATSPKDWNTLLLSSPDFMRR